jgi:peptidyl-prolyl cis-trans isomerase B (cyclophilin B)
MKKILKISIVTAAILFAYNTDLTAQAKGKGGGAKKPASTKQAAPASFVEPWNDPNNKEKYVEITTAYGPMIAKLYNTTPLHRDNFLKLVQQNFYDSLLFHRVIDGFMIQGGDPTSKNAPAGVPLGSGSVPGDRVPAEFNPALFHKKGALAAARDNNPEKASSNCQFYIVQGKPGEPNNPGVKYNKAQKEIYSRIGGTPFLDQSYTVFGEVVSGLDVIDRIAKVPKGQADRPVQDVQMKIRLLN